MYIYIICIYICICENICINIYKFIYCICVFFSICTASPRLTVSVSSSRTDKERGKHKMGYWTACCARVPSTYRPHASLGWRTRQQLQEMYGERAANALVERKTRLGHVREHPDFPGDQTMLLYYAADLQQVSAP